MKLKALLRKFSVLINEATGGPKGWTLCARWWHGRINGCRFSRIIVAVINKLMWFDKDHCRKSWINRSNK